MTSTGGDASRHVTCDIVCSWTPHCSSIVTTVVAAKSPSTLNADCCHPPCSPGWLRCLLPNPDSDCSGRGVAPKPLQPASCLLLSQGKALYKFSLCVCVINIVVRDSQEDPEHHPHGDRPLRAGPLFFSCWHHPENMTIRSDELAEPMMSTSC